MSTFDPADRDKSILWARNVLNSRANYIICDTETTGIGYEDEVIQISVITLNRDIIINSLIKPKEKKSISRDATRIHGLKKKDLIDAPRFDLIYPSLIESFTGKTILIYNAEFDRRLIYQSCFANRLPEPKQEYECVMLQYSRYRGEWNDYYDDYKYQKLRGGDHTALGDCLATLKTIEMMAKAKLSFLDINDQPILEESVKVITKEADNAPVKKWWRWWK